jgi:hypothetical protein
MSPHGPDEIDELLEQLNRWEHDYGTAHGPAAGLASTGEAPARIATLKERLAEAGAVFRWDGDRYVLEHVAAPREGRELGEQ